MVLNILYSSAFGLMLLGNSTIELQYCKDVTNIYRRINAKLTLLKNKYQNIFKFCKLISYSQMTTTSGPAGAYLKF